LKIRVVLGNADAFFGDAQRQPRQFEGLRMLDNVVTGDWRVREVVVARTIRLANARPEHGGPCRSPYVDGNLTMRRLVVWFVSWIVAAGALAIPTGGWSRPESP
jgi:hypothetical protein